MKKGFTLIELLAVIAILAVIALIAIPSVDKSVNEGKEQMLETQKAQLIKGAKDYLTMNTDKLPSSGSIILYVGDLQEAGFLELNLKNPSSDNYISPNAQIEVKAVGNGYKYTVKEETLNSDSAGSSSDKPTIVLNGGALQYVEIGSVFTDKGYSATSKYGADLTANVKTIIKNKSGIAVSEVDTSNLGTYVIEYTVSDPNTSLSSSVKRTVMVVDTTKPTITLTKGDYLSITASQVSGFDYDSLASATDNSGETVNLTYKSNLSQITGSYYIIFSAVDSSGNEATKRITVSVTDGIVIDVADANNYVDSKKVTITFPSYSGYTSQYSLDFGVTWKNVTSSSVSFNLTSETIIIARLYNGTDSKISVTYSVSKFNK